MDEPGDIATALARILDTHGYGFQYTVLAAVEQRFKPGEESAWRRPNAEFPGEI